MEFSKYKFKDICLDKGFIRGPFGSALKKSLFVPKGIDTYKVYEQCVPLEQNKSGGNYYISGEYFRNSLRRFEVKHNDFLVSCSGVNYGAIYHLQEPFEKGVINQALLIIRINEKIVDYNYFKYLFKVLLSKVITSGTGDSTIPNFPSIDVIKDIDVFLPPLPMQCVVGKLLNDIDVKITSNNTTNDTLQQMVKTIYDYWFTQFDFPDENGKPYRSSGGQMVWNEHLKREIPAWWTVASIVDNPISTVIKPGIEHFTYKEYLATAEVSGTTISNGTIIDYDSRESRANMQPSINSVWFAKMKNSVKHLFLNKEMQPLIEGVVLSTGFCGIQCNDIAFEYISSFISSDYFETIKDVLAHGATQEAVNNEDMLSIRLLIPDDIVLKRHHEATKAIFSQISKNICENRQLIQLRDWLLPMLMNGQATVSD
ncbi:MAG: restriction endonuclease subunit S [Lachnospiraceae bacterium]|nr:restriction endonuclease subunit S [Lachnospiraceae bacterium]